jgi:uncharacterized protein YbgA (DUF1722 family)
VIAIADLVKELKRESSVWVKTKAEDLCDFHWLNRYGASSVSPGHVAALKEYIVNQEEHQKTETFQEEYRRLLRLYGIKWDERYIWD